MPVFQKPAYRTESAPSRGTEEPRRLRAALVLAAGVLLALPQPSAARDLILSRIHFPDTFRLHADPPRFDPPPAPWLVALEPPLAEEPKGVGPPSREIAGEYAREASASLLKRAEGSDLVLAAQLESVCAPLGLIRAVSPGESPDSGTAAYLMLSSLILFTGSTLLGYLTRPHPAYSLTDRLLAAGGRPPPPLLLLPAVPERG
ncbi:MAG: hypothetical protein M9913_19080 [Bryobacteraceae bacterium]|nr:hypothetical protein [Solibacteraceae bacterium]MCL4841795.1 hypothetical protein [Bryobacteraceae bacterium]MCO5352963.1 hypothetical protein [Bryobacteraceae bacterium]